MNKKKLSRKEREFLLEHGSLQSDVLKESTLPYNNTLIRYEDIEQESTNHAVEPELELEQEWDKPSPFSQLLQSLKHGSNDDDESQISQSDDENDNFDDESHYSLSNDEAESSNFDDQSQCSQSDDENDENQSNHSNDESVHVDVQSESGHSNNESDNESDNETDSDDETMHEQDIFDTQFNQPLIPNSNKQLKATQSEVLGNIVHSSFISMDKTVANDPPKYLKQRLIDPWFKHKQNNLQNTSNSNKKQKTDFFNPLQQELYNHIALYRDVLYSKSTKSDNADIMSVLALHCLNHISKTRDKIIKNSLKIKKAHEDGVDIGELRDQGYTRPKVLILLPFKNNAFQFINILMSLSPTSQTDNSSRFQKEFSIDKEDDVMDNRKPQDYKDIFEGNIDDCFRIGIKLNRKSLKLFTEFYSSDILIASPLGLRMIIGSEGDKERDYDFLSSIEILIIDQATTLQMQNMDHLQHVLNHTNLLPTEIRSSTDFGRVRQWYLDNESKSYRQTLVFSSFLTPELNNIWNTQMNSHSGKVKIKNSEKEGTISDVAVKGIRHVFTRIKTTNLQSNNDQIFEYFVNKLFPVIKTSVILQNKTCIFIPSYFDFVRVKMWLKKQEIEFTYLSEYCTPAEISRARSNFFHGLVPFLLITERFHFFRRYNIRGINSLVFYGLPTNPQFYPELINMITNSSSSYTSPSLALEKSISKVSSNTSSRDFDASTMVLFTKYDQLKLERIIGAKRTEKVIKGEKEVYMFC